VELTGFDILSTDQLYVLCGDFQSATDFVTALDTKGLLMVSERLELTESHLLPAAIHIFNELTSRLGEILETEEIFAIA
jgi:hypothetical protein